MKKIFLIFVGIMAALLCLSGCSSINRVLNEKQLQDMLIEQYPESIERDVQNEPTIFEIDSFKIVRRQTYKEEKKDIVDCKMLAHTNDYEAEFCYTLNLDYYDEGGWQLDDYFETSADVLKAKTNTVPDNVIQEKMEKIQAAYGKCELVNENFDTETGILQHTYNVDCDSKYLTAKGNVTVDYKLDRHELNPGFVWLDEEKENAVTQKWKLEKEYEFEAGIYHPFYAFTEGNYQNGIHKGVHSLSIDEITDNRINFTAEILERIWIDGHIGEWHRSSESITLDVSSSDREMEIFCGNGDSLSIGFDVESGLYLHVQKFDGDETVDMKRSFTPRKS